MFNLCLTQNEKVAPGVAKRYLNHGSEIERRDCVIRG